MSLRHVSCFSALALLLPASVALAGPFFDVPDDHPYVEALTDLKQRAVMVGDTNPDGSLKGTVRPDDHLNRAELLALAHRASGKETRAVHRGCFPDTKGLWAEDIICTQKVEYGAIQGRQDGKFYPGDLVNNVEMLKMVENALGFAIPTLTLENKVGLDFKNVNINSWYAPYLLTAVVHDLLPEELTQDNDFHPDAFPTRGVAAEIIHRALLIPPGERSRLPDAAHKPTDLPPGAVLVELPFDRKARTAERGAAVLIFESESEGAVLIEAENETSPSVGAECFLYLLGTSGLPEEIFIGYQEGARCLIRAAVRPNARYQLEVRAVEAGEIIAVKGGRSPGDGNDGYSEAVSLERGTPVQGTLAGSGPDYEDWFRFTLTQTATRIVNLSSDASLVCSVIPSAGVDLPSFDSPHCKESFSYPPGVYYVSVQRAPPASADQEYTIELR